MTVCSVIMSLLLLGVTPERPLPAEACTPSELTRSAHEAVDAGLAWLAAHQAADGSFGGRSHYGPHVAITALAGLAMLSDGQMPDRGQYAHVIDGCVQFVLDNCDEDGLISAEASHGPMYGHGFATLFLAEVYGTIGDERVGPALRRAVRLIVETQNEEGGWRYHPTPNDADLSVTVCQVMALRAARNVGVYVPKTTIARSIQYIKDSQNSEGGFRYMLNSGGSAFARSAAAVAALQYAGIYRGSEIRRGIDYVHKFVPGRSDSVGHFFYGHYYAVQAMFLAGGEDWQRWWPAVRDDLTGRQLDDGSWDGQAGDEYGTSMALIVLQLPKRLLPIFQK